MLKRGRVMQAFWWSWHSPHSLGTWKLLVWSQIAPTESNSASSQSSAWGWNQAISPQRAEVEGWVLTWQLGVSVAHQRDLKSAGMFSCQPCFLQHRLNSHLSPSTPSMTLPVSTVAFLFTCFLERFIAESLHAGKCQKVPVGSSGLTVPFHPTHLQ